MINRIITIIAFLTITTGLILNTYLITLMLMPVKVVQIEEPIEVIEKQTNYSYGDEVQFKIEYCKYIKAEAEIDKTVIPVNHNAKPIEFDDETLNTPPGCGRIIPNSLKITEEISPGSWELVLTIDYEPNPLRKERYVVHSETFLVN